MQRESKKIGYVAFYEFDLKAAEKNVVIRKFNAADMEWLLFVVNNRRGVPLSETTDMYIGPVADDNVYQSIRLFETGILDEEDTIKRLKTEVLHDQWTFHTEKALSYIQFTEYQEVR